MIYMEVAEKGGHTLLGSADRSPRLETLNIRLFKQLTFSVPHLVQFMNTTENLRFNNVKITFKNEYIDMLMYFREPNTQISVDCWQLDWQVSSTVQSSNALNQVFFCGGAPHSSTRGSYSVT